MQDQFTTGISNAAIGANLAVMVDSAVIDGVKLPTGATVETLGITAEAVTASGCTISVQHAGMAKVIAAGTVARGDKVKIDTAGKITTTTTQGDLCIGIVMKGCATGELATVLLRRIVVL